MPGGLFKRRIRAMITTSALAFHHTPSPGIGYGSLSIYSFHLELLWRLGAPKR